MAKREKYSKAGQEVTVKAGKYAGQKYLIDDWWLNVAGRSWKDSSALACLDYSQRAKSLDDEVLYGHIHGLGKLIHVSEVE